MNNNEDDQLSQPQMLVYGDTEIPEVSPSPISAGFPSPAEDFAEPPLDLNKLLIRNPAATYYARVHGLSMVNDGIDDGDLILIDKSMDPYNGCIAVCYVDGEFTLKRFQRYTDYALLMPANPNFQPIKVTADNDFLIWGVVRYIIKKV